MIFQCLIGYGFDGNTRFFASTAVLYLCFSDYSIKNKRSESA